MDDWTLGPLRPPISVAEADAVWSLVEACFGSSWSRAAFDSALTGKNALVIVAKRPRFEIGGFLLARRVLDEVELDLIGVEPSCRGKGLAGRLLDALMGAENHRGARVIQLDVRRSNEAARRLYTSRGFVVVGERSRYYPDGEDAILLTCVLPLTVSPEPGAEREV